MLVMAYLNKFQKTHVLFNIYTNVIVISHTIVLFCCLPNIPPQFVGNATNIPDKINFIFVLNQ